MDPRGVHSLKNEKTEARTNQKKEQIKKPRALKTYALKTDETSS
jgi:hypothetical protein